MLWLCLHLPLLPLEVFLRGGAASTPLVVSVSKSGRDFVYLCDRQAEMAGVTSAMPLSAARALVPNLSTRSRNETAEALALARLAGWCNQYSAFVSIKSPNDVLLEINASLRLFHGVNALLEMIHSGLSELGYSVYTAVAPSPIGAQLLARTRGAQVLHKHSLQSALEGVPLSWLDLDSEVLTRLQKMGVSTFGECLRLPRDGLARRFGPEVVTYFDRALGKRADPLCHYEAPPSFSARLPLPAEADHLEALLFPIRRLALELCGFLRGKDGGVQSVTIELVHRIPPVQRFSVGLVAASREANYLVELISERLANMALRSPVIAVGLSADNICSLAPRTVDLFDRAQISQESAEHFIDRLRVRLGEMCAEGLTLKAEHRPEYAWSSCPLGDKKTDQTAIRHSRPLWLLTEPQVLKVKKEQPYFDGPLTLLEGPERIEAGWWDGKDIARDYYIARNDLGSRVWIFRERRRERKWFLHGFFA